MTRTPEEQADRRFAWLSIAAFLTLFWGAVAMGLWAVFT